MSPNRTLFKVVGERKNDLEPSQQITYFHELFGRFPQCSHKKSYIRLSRDTAICAGGFDCVWHTQPSRRTEKRRMKVTIMGLSETLHSLSLASLRIPVLPTSGSVSVLDTWEFVMADYCSLSRRVLWLINGRHWSFKMSFLTATKYYSCPLSAKFIFVQWCHRLQMPWSIRREDKGSLRLQGCRWSDGGKELIKLI